MLHGFALRRFTRPDPLNSLQYPLTDLAVLKQLGAQHSESLAKIQRVYMVGRVIYAMLMPIWIYQLVTPFNRFEIFEGGYYANHYSWGIPDYRAL
jgi:hypothetical protein